MAKRASKSEENPFMRYKANFEFRENLHSFMMSLRISLVHYLQCLGLSHKICSLHSQRLLLNRLRAFHLLA